MAINSRLSIVATPEEIREVADRAKAEGFTLSGWIRSKLDMPPARPRGRVKSSKPT